MKLLGIIKNRITNDKNYENVFNCMLSSCHTRFSESIYTLQLSECQRTPCSKQSSYPKFKWQQRDSNPQPLSS